MSKYELQGGKVSRGDTFSKLLHHLREAQDQAALLGHLHKSEDNNADKVLGQGWLGVSEMLGNVAIQVTEFAKRGIH